MSAPLGEQPRSFSLDGDMRSGPIRGTMARLPRSLTHLCIHEGGFSRLPRESWTDAEIQSTWPQGENWTDAEIRPTLREMLNGCDYGNQKDNNRHDYETQKINIYESGDLWLGTVGDADGLCG
jgi:hypothetical protein